MHDRLVVTGASGFIGKHLVDNLISSHIHVTKISHQDFNQPEILSAALGNVDVIIHLAGLTKGSEDEMNKANVESTKRILEAIAKSGEKPILIFTSTFAVYKEQRKRITEETSTVPRNAYGRSKLEAENLVREYAEQYGFVAIILRLSNVYGPGMPPYSHSVVATFMDQIIHGKQLSISSNGEQKRDFVYISDVIDALRKAVKEGKKGGQFQIFNICSSEETSINELVKEIGILVGLKVKSMYPNSSERENGNWIGDNKKAKKILKWFPLVSFSEGLKRTYEETE